MARDLASNVRWVLVTGGAVRLGREVGLAFARAGWNVACHYNRSAEAAALLQSEVEALGSQCVTVQGPLDAAEHARSLFERTLAAVGAPLACIVNNASTFLPDGAGDFTSEGLLGQLQTNLLVPLELTRALHGHAAAVGHAASVVHVLDQKVLNLNPDYFSYTLSKLALERAVAQQAQALAPVLRVNAVAPGLLYPSGPQSEENYRTAALANLLRRPIVPREVAEAARFLAENPCITAATLPVDNGQHLVPLPRDILFVVDELLARIRHEQA